MGNRKSENEFDKYLLLADLENNKYDALKRVNQAIEINPLEYRGWIKKLEIFSKYGELNINDITSAGFNALKMCDSLCIKEVEKKVYELYISISFDLNWLANKEHEWYDNIEIFEALFWKYIPNEAYSRIDTELIISILNVYIDRAIKKIRLNCIYDDNNKDYIRLMNEANAQFADKINILSALLSTKDLQRSKYEEYKNFNPLRDKIILKKKKDQEAAKKAEMNEKIRINIITLCGIFGPILYDYYIIENDLLGEGHIFNGLFALIGTPVIILFSLIYYWTSK